jgi:hypothetical protein
MGSKAFAITQNRAWKVEAMPFSPGGYLTKGEILVFLHERFDQKCQAFILLAPLSDSRYTSGLL